LEARGLVGTARSSPQPPLAVARRARLEVVVPTDNLAPSALMKLRAERLRMPLWYCRGPSFSPRSVDDTEEMLDPRHNDRRIRMTLAATL
jgi:hypothetical protein